MIRLREAFRVVWFSLTHPFVFAAANSEVLSALAAPGHVKPSQSFGKG